MLPLKNRLKKEKDFQRIFSSGKVVSSELASIRFLNNDIQKTRIGFIVSKKTFKRAVLRNKIKRTLREEMRKKMSGIKEGIDLIVIAKGKISESRTRDIKTSLEKLLEKIKTLNDGII